MKHLIFSCLFLASIITVHGQSEEPKKFISSLEFHVGGGNLSIANRNEFIVDNNLCIDLCTLSILQNPILELNAKLLGQFQLAETQELLVGAGFNVWNYEVDHFIGFTGTRDIGISEQVGIVDFMLGYRYVVKQYDRLDFFAEVFYNLQVVTAEKFVLPMSVFQPGIGCRLHTSEKTAFTFTISNKFGLNDISPDPVVRDTHRSNVLGARGGIVRKL